MNIEEPEPCHGSDHILDWLVESVSILPSFLDDPYNTADVNTSDPWWEKNEEICQDPISNNTNLGSSSGIDTNTTSLVLVPSNFNISSHLQTSDSSNKRKILNDPDSKRPLNHPHHHQQRRSQNRKVNGNEEQEGEAAVEEVGSGKRSSGSKRSGIKATGNNCNNGNREGRWAEQLLNPCASAITAGNLSRVQHFLYVLHELASPTGDANHRLAAHGLRALIHHLSSSAATFSNSSSSSSSSAASVGPITFASTEPKLFQRSLIKFYELSPWFAFPNNIANASILQILAYETDHSRSLHILDIGVSHGVQWPILLEALTRRSGGPPPLVRITVITPTAETDQNTETPFSIGPPGDNFSTRLLNFAKSMNINLQINRLGNHGLQDLNAQVINTNPEETLIVSAQFRLHHLNHNTPDERTGFLRFLRSLEPKGVILSENNMECSCSSCGDFATGFSRRVECLWRFLDSTSSAFKGRESEERRVMEGEAAKALTNLGEMNEVKDKWCERMRGAGFVGEAFGEEAMDGARALLRKYDSNWEVRIDERDGCLGLWWKGQPVSFCSLWKLDLKGNDS